jgi:hypothetical protein
LAPPAARTSPFGSGVRVAAIRPAFRLPAAARSRDRRRRAWRRSVWSARVPQSSAETSANLPTCGQRQRPASRTGRSRYERGTPSRRRHVNPTSTGDSPTRQRGSQPLQHRQQPAQLTGRTPGYARRAQSLRERLTPTHSGGYTRGLPGQNLTARATRVGGNTQSHRHRCSRDAVIGLEQGPISRSSACSG